MLSGNMYNKLNELLKISMEEGKNNELSNICHGDGREVVPRLVITNNSKHWQETIIKAIDLDRANFKSDEFIIRCIGASAGVLKFEGNFSLALHNILASVGSNDNMVIIVENKINKFLKGSRVNRMIKFVYIILQN